MPLAAARERQQDLAQLEGFRFSLLSAIAQSGKESDRLRAAIEQALSAECGQCGIHVTAAELLAEVPGSVTTAQEAKIQRLRRGECARSGCDTYYYTLRFADHPDLNWDELLTLADSREAASPARLTPETGGGWVATLWLGKRLWIRIGIGLAVVVLLLAARHWHRGGSIPLIRQPENFQVDRLPDEHAEAERQVESTEP
jgi:hypothetical protein